MLYECVSKWVSVACGVKARLEKCNMYNPFTIIHEHSFRDHNWWNKRVMLWFNKLCGTHCTADFATFYLRTDMFAARTRCRREEVKKEGASPLLFIYLGCHGKMVAEYIDYQDMLFLICWRWQAAVVINEMSWLRLCSQVSALSDHSHSWPLLHFFRIALSSFVKMMHPLWVISLPTDCC